MIISTTSPTPEGEMLWCVRCSGSWYDSDPRGPGDVSVSASAYVLARSMKEAIKKADSAFATVRSQSDKSVKIEASIVTIETLVAAAERQGSNFYGGNLKQIEIHGEDAKRYSLGVCLIPVE